MDSLWYEEERLATFIDWPVKFISYQELAREGFYYLRTKDHCACAFCRGIIGAWEEGDTPRGEHLKHFPHCPFIQGKVTPNVPLQQGAILARVRKPITTDTNINTGIDVCGGRKDEFETCSESSKYTCPFKKIYLQHLILT
ncbi:UNVERIFIED_CONTAM: hypothetical protein GTU68_066477 [Idotea baltica]|nr:hypothetical protein [Idotea baltica]